jgi:hypothetical protein
MMSNWEDTPRDIMHMLVCWWQFRDAVMQDCNTILQQQAADGVSPSL